MLRIQLQKNKISTFDAVQYQSMREETNMYK